MGKGSFRSYFLKGPVKIGGFLNELDLLDKSCFKLFKLSDGDDETSAPLHNGFDVVVGQDYLHGGQ